MVDILRRLLGSVRLILAVVIGVPVLFCMGAMAVYQFFNGSGDLHVVPSEVETVSISIDNGPPEIAGPLQHWRRSVPQGTHHVAITGPLGLQQMDVNVSNGFFSGLVPTSASQCWVEVDGTHFYFGTSRTLPTVVGRHQGTEVVSVGGAYLSEQELPSSIDEHASVRMLVPTPCALMQQPDDIVIRQLGYSM